MRKQTSLRQPSQTSRRWVRPLALVLILIAIFLLVRALLPHHLPQTTPNNPAAVNPAPVQFDFYTVLPKMAVSSAPTPPPKEISPSAKTSPMLTTLPPVLVEKPLVPGMYVLQIAAVRQIHDAERLREQMHNLGFPVFIQPYQAEEALWYRVMIGPYPSQDIAQRRQEELQGHRINSLLLKMQPRR